MISIYEYEDYRQFLKDFAAERRESNPHFSYRYMGARVGMDSSTLAKVFSGKRHISNDAIPRFARLCDLKDREIQYFDVIVRFSKARKKSDMEHLYRQMLHLKPLQVYGLAADQYDFYSTWYASAILMLFEIHTFKGDFGWLARSLRPPITTRQARETVQLLVNLGLLKKEDSGHYRLTHKLLANGDPRLAMAVKKFQESTLQLASDSLFRDPKEERNISTVTLTFRAEDQPVLDERIADFQQSILKLAEECADPNTVYQLNVQLFPLTKTIPGKRK